jgi:hypothetical protein
LWCMDLTQHRTGELGVLRGRARRVLPPDRGLVDRRSPASRTGL